MAYIDSTSFGNITIDGKTYGDDVIILADDRIKKRGLQKGTHIVCIEEIEPLFKENPKVIVIGTGQSGVAEIEPEVMNRAREQNIEVIEAPTPIAIKKFNKIKEKKAGLFHLTC
ncbi:MAG: hypothetical protein IB618_01325 [Candidatus Pacearchaeota archaeon]|nr:MAG: hypothetical protein IB618_01325 [Candidatus Pacearchaeota archaeon]